ncbi:MAG: hypothetical protein WAL29_16360 [Bacteroidales bacterium]
MKADSWDDPEFDILQSPKDTALFGKISRLFRALSDIEEIKNDPAYHPSKELAEEMISCYGKDPLRKIENGQFIRNSLQAETQEDDLISEISQIKCEANQSGLNDISSEWVREWQEKKQKSGNRDADTQEIRNFITSSLNPEEPKNDIMPDDIKKIRFSKSRIFKFTSLAAASIIGFVFLIRSLIPSGEPGKIFEKYYEPFDAVPVLTRSAGTGENELLDRAIGFYKSGNYEAARAGFSEARTTSLSAGFFLGLTELELGNYSGASDLLEEVATRQGEYSTEANWYLGLANLKAGNKEKASGYFEALAGSAGFYNERSEKILRRLR